MNKPDLIIDKPFHFTGALVSEVIALIAEGGQITAIDAKLGVHRAALLGIAILDGQVVAAACFKNPRESYRHNVFGFAKVPEQAGFYDHELGYIVTRTGFEGRGFCQLLLAELFPKIVHQPMFATTRKPGMAHILTKLGFNPLGNSYKEDLQLFVYEPGV